MPKVLVPLATGFEEIEAISVIDLLRRAGVEVISAGLDGQPVRASRGTTHIPDTTLDAVLEDDFDMVVLPGGQPGADNLNRDERVRGLLHKMASRGKFTAAICAAPKVLADAGILKGRVATGFPGVLEAMGLTDTRLSDAAVVRDGQVITSRGPGTAMDFALELIELLTDGATRDRVEAALQRPSS